MTDLVYPSILRNKFAFPASIFFTFFKRENTRTSSFEDSVMLFMPKDFGQPNTVSWDTFKATEAILGAGERIPGLGKVVGAMRSGMEVAGDLGTAATGAIINPYLTQIFRGVNFRNFSYEFNLAPFHPSDCDVILNIVKTFRKWALPEGEANDWKLGYPGEVEVQYQFFGEENPWIHKFKRSVITDIDINYTGAGMWGMMRNGFPAETVLRLTLSEIEIVTRPDVEERNY